MIDKSRILQSIKAFKVSITIFSIGSFILLCFLFLFLFPEHKLSKKLDTQLDIISFDLETQKQLNPLYYVLSEKLEKSKIKGIETLRLGNDKLDRNSIDQISFILKQVTLQNDLTFDNIELDIKSLNKESEFLPINIAVGGEFLKFMRYLNKLYEIVYVKDIVEIDIKAKSELNEFFIKVNIGLK